MPDSPTSPTWAGGISGPEEASPQPGTHSEETSTVHQNPWLDVWQKPEMLLLVGVYIYATSCRCSLLLEYSLALPYRDKHSPGQAIVPDIVDMEMNRAALSLRKVTSGENDGYKVPNEPQDGMVQHAELHGMFF